MARFSDEQAPGGNNEFVERIKDLVSAGKTVEVYQKSVDSQKRLFFRVWTGKRADASNTVAADPEKDY